MIAIIAGRSIKKPARLRLGDEVLNRELGFDYRAMIRTVANEATAVGLLDYVAYRGHTHTVMVTLDNTKHGVLLHTSVSRRDTDPTWETIKAVKTLVYGDIDVMMVLPKAELYVNVHQHCFHLWQMPVAWEIG